MEDVLSKYQVKCETIFIDCRKQPGGTGHRNQDDDAVSSQGGVFAVFAWRTSDIDQGHTMMALSIRMMTISWRECRLV